MTAPNPPASPLARGILTATGVVVLLTLLLGFLAMFRPSGPAKDQYIQQANVGKNYYDQGDAAKAMDAFEKALRFHPNQTNALLNLANACLRANQSERTADLAHQVLQIDPASGAANYLAGCAALRLGEFTNAVHHFQLAKQADRTINPVSFLLGRAFQQLGQLEAAVEQFQEVVRFEPEHPAAHYNLSQALVRLGQEEQAQQALETHQKLHAGKPSQITDPAVFEKCPYTQVRVPFVAEQPVPKGIVVTFHDATSQAFAPNAGSYFGPVGILDPDHDGHPELFVRESSNTFRLLVSSNGTFLPAHEPIPASPDGQYQRALVGDLNNDRVDDVLILGQKTTHVFKFDTNGLATDLTRFSRMQDFKANDGVLVDIDFTGTLDLVALGGETNGVRIIHNLGQPYFVDVTTNSGPAGSLTGIRQAVVEDWTGDDLLDLILLKPGQAPVIQTKIRGGALITTNTPVTWPAAEAMVIADFDNDFKLDVVALSNNTLTCILSSRRAPLHLPVDTVKAQHLAIVDYDNDGWLDLIAYGQGLRTWRNLGKSGFQDPAQSMGFQSLASTPITDVAAADLDFDGDTDLMLTLGSGRVQLWKNEGGNANRQLKVHLVGTKSNASGLGTRLEVTSAGLRLRRRIAQLPVEIGVGQRQQLDSFTAHWFDFDVGMTDVPVEPTSVLTFLEPQIRDGSCPYLYAWDGTRYRFVTDILGNAPLGLPLSDTRYVQSFPFEHIWLGTESRLQPRQGQFTVQITEELREVLYLDETKLLVADHPAGTEVHTTSKLLPGGPFTAPSLITLHNRKPLLHASTDEGRDVTSALADVDSVMVSPSRMRVSQLRGLAEPHQIILDFGELQTDKPWILTLTGWLRYGGGTANVAASRNADLPFPFPTLEVETPSGSWKPIDVVVGAPAGNTKTILVDLDGKLHPGSHRLKISAAFELHWDRAALFEKRDPADTRVTVIEPGATDLHERGYSQYLPQPWGQPLTPDYATVKPTPPWRVTPSGWATRYGSVDELIAGTDNALALVAAGDELTVEFPAERVSPLPPGSTRDFFLSLVGWDKDSDFHVARGTQMEPLPWHGFDDQRYGEQPRPAFPNDAWIQKYNTRWVGPDPRISRR